MNKLGLIYKDDLYRFTEQEIIQKIEMCDINNISKSFKKFRNTTYINEGEEPPNDKYCISLNVKKRYIIPLVNYERINNVSTDAKKIIDNYLDYKSPTYGWVDFNI